jgi:exosortase family protein XrtF
MFSILRRFFLSITLRNMDFSKPLTRFLIKAVVLYLGWHLLWYQWIEPDGRVNHYLTYNTAWISQKALNLFSSSEFTISPFEEQNTYLFKDKIPVVLIEHGCNGLILMVLFAAFVIAFPGPWKTKVWYVPAGILAIYLINSLRVIGLALNRMFSNESFEFNHKYTFTILVYGAIFWFWMIWVNRFSGIQFGGKK